MTRKVLFGSALALAAGLQLFQPSQPRASLAGEGVISDHVAVPDDIDAILRRACYDCHSDETSWPWYARVSPVSWFLVRDVEHGLSNLDFSHWSTDSVVEPTPAQRLNGICRDVERDIMPPRQYLWLHPSAAVTPLEQDELCAWTARALQELPGDR